MGARGYVLITRPEPDASQFGADLGALGYDIIVDPVMMIETLSFALPDFSEYNAVIFTSPNAVRALASQVSTIHKNVAAFCVGDQTAQEAARFFSQAISAGGNQNDLKSLLIRQFGKDKPELPLLYVRGEDISGDLEGDLVRAGVPCQSLVVYRARPSMRLQAATLHALAEGRVIVIPLFSARTARIFFELAEQVTATQALNTIKFLCLSDSVLESVPASRRAQAYICAAPTRDAMMALIKTHMPL